MLHSILGPYFYIFGWILIGLITAIVRLRWVEGPELIRKAEGQRMYESTFNSDVMFYGGPRDWIDLAEWCRNNTDTGEAILAFFQYSILLGPLSTLACAFGFDVYAEQRKRKN